MRLLAHGVAAAAVALLGGGCSGRGGDDGKLVVGMELEYPPFETVDQSGAPAGVSVDLARALASELGRELVIRDYKFRGLPAALVQGEIDLVISSMTATEERAKTIAFSDPYARIGLALLVREGSGIDGIDALVRSGAKVAVKLGTTGEAFADARLQTAEILRFEHAGACAIEVAQGKVDAFIYDQLSVLEFARNHPGTRAVLEPLQVEEWAIGLNQGDVQLRQQVNAFLEKFRAAGGFERLAQEHLSSQRARFREAGVPFIF